MYNINKYILYIYIMERTAQKWMKIRAELVKLINKTEGIKHVSKEMGARINKIIAKEVGSDWKEKGLKYDEVMDKVLKFYKKLIINNIYII